LRNQKGPNGENLFDFQLYEGETNGEIIFAVFTKYVIELLPERAQLFIKEIGTQFTLDLNCVNFPITKREILDAVTKSSKAAISETPVVAGSEISFGVKAFNENNILYFPSESRIQIVRQANVVSGLKEEFVKYESLGDNATSSYLYKMKVTKEGSYKVSGPGFTDAQSIFTVDALEIPH
jgi:hypothetical protein